VLKVVHQLSAKGSAMGIIRQSAPARAYCKAIAADIKNINGNNTDIGKVLAMQQKGIERSL